MECPSAADNRVRSTQAADDARFRCEAPAAETVALTLMARNPAARRRYAEAALSLAPRLLGSIDRNPYRATYGCLDRQFWHYRTAAFPSGMYQEGALPLALLWATPLPGNRWCGSERVRELAVAALRFAARSGHRDGSCDDYYPFERALGAAVFTLAAATRAYRILQLDDEPLRRFIERRARWVMRHDESGVLANHHALAALGLWLAADVTGRDQFAAAASQRIERLLAWQSTEGWFEEYGGADPGYQTVTIDCLAKLHRQAPSLGLAEPLARATAFARLFLHPDDSYGGEYGSRGTYHFYPHGFELRARDSDAAADLADGFLRSLAAGTNAAMNDDRMFIHRLGNLIEAYADWSPWRPDNPANPELDGIFHLRHARMVVERQPGIHTVVSVARGGVFKRFVAGKQPITDAGLIVQLADGRVAVSQQHRRDRELKMVETLSSLEGETQRVALSVAGRLSWASFETASPLKQAALHLGMSLAGRWFRTAARKLLQRRLITGRSAAPIRLTRTCEFGSRSDSKRQMIVRDVIELLDPRVTVSRMSFATDLEAAYVAASGFYQPGVLAPWTELGEHVAALNDQRTVTIERRL